MTAGVAAQEPRTVVMFSGGLGSFAAAYRAISRGDQVTLLFADTRAEDVDCYRFIREAAEVLDVPLVTVADGRTPWDVADDEGMIPNSRVPLCSRRLKHEPTRRWLDEHAPDALVVVGIGWDEEHRCAGIRAGHKPRDVWFPMCEPPYWMRDECAALARSLGVEPQRMYAHNYSHSNCSGACLRAGQAAWRHLLLDSPEEFARQEAREEAFRARTGKDVAILRDRSGPREGMALPLVELRRRVEASEPTLDLLDWGGCGCTSGDAA